MFGKPCFTTPETQPIGVAMSASYKPICFCFSKKLLVSIGGCGFLGVMFADKYKVNCLTNIPLFAFSFAICFINYFYS